MTYGDGTYGDGDFAGNQVQTQPLVLKATKKSASIVTISWTPPAGAIGYIFLRNGVRISNTYNAALSQTNFSFISGDTFQVHAITTLASGVVKL